MITSFFADSNDSRSGVFIEAADSAFDLNVLSGESTASV